ncbi:uncharacterized protein LOC133888788 isoform X2 [Phragmites australis]|uniref:uncharacterized protein LOC133888788 isoform X2 n=1 Tax=Phragmites australis TaxID=29695 RepID=UPI002D78A26E|nr:uncharacterized protein LOC133888788 isoform X2 [Phragmites australis]
MDAADDVAVMPGFLELDFNLDDFDFDFDLAADEFCDAYSAKADKSGGGGVAPDGGWLAGLRGDGGSRREGSPDSGVTDGPLAAEGDGAISAYVSELERFLMEDDDDEVGEVTCPDGERVEELGADDYFGHLLAGDVVVDGVAASAGADQNAEEENVVLAAREDEPTSMKRARHKIKSTVMMQWAWEELEVRRRHLASIQVPAPWLPAAVRCM